MDEIENTKDDFGEQVVPEMGRPFILLGSKGW
jgi:hypothetical protein